MKSAHHIPILVTGAARDLGAIGRNVTALLLAKGHKVMAGLNGASRGSMQIIGGFWVYAGILCTGGSGQLKPDDVLAQSLPIGIVISGREGWRVPWRQCRRPLPRSGANGDTRPAAVGSTRYRRDARPLQ
jgi:hypothetical protein